MPAEMKPHVYENDNSYNIYVHFPKKKSETTI